MSKYSVIFKPSVEKDLRKIPAAMVDRLFQRIDGLTADPFPPQSLKLAGGEFFYRIRVGDYRIVYQVDTEEKQIVIQYIRHRRDVYRDL
ncbi:MAG: type II toxin-antitoxin system RelE/ParE family toxin [Chlorobium sp.]|nr:MAG: type II toxin-antitoxin system RelE/ParE family toxin [Chlorobium sp.]